MLSKIMPRLWVAFLMLLVMFAAILTGMLLSPRPTQAAGTVTDCTKFGPGAGTLQAAVAGGGVVQFSCDGTIPVTSTIPITTSTTLDATGHNVTLSGGDNVQLLTVSTDITLTLRHITLANADYGGDGGAIYLNAANLDVSDSTFSNNNAGRGGAILSTGNNTTHTISIFNSTFLSNTSSSGGGAIYLNGTSSRTVANIFNTVFDQNQSANGNGGGLFDSDGTLNVAISTFSNNVATNAGGGGIYSQALLLNIAGTNFHDNRADNGGGLANYGFVSNILTSTFYSNQAVTGGGIAHAYGILNLALSSVSNNTADNGAGISNTGGFINPNILNVFNSTIISNTATNVGGGIYNTTQTTPPFAAIGVNANIANSTISGNQAAKGGGIGTLLQRASGGGTGTPNASTIITNVTFYNNTATNNGNSVFNNVAGPGSSIYSTTNTILASGTAGTNCAGTLNGANNLQYPSTSCGASFTVAQPLLGPLANNGGLTLTHALSDGSPAIDAGNDAACAAFPVANRDQRLFSRPQGPHCDIGSYEKAASNLQSPTLSKAFWPNTITAGSLATLYFTITNPNVVSLTQVTFTDTLPSQIRVASTPNITTTCQTPGSVVVTGTNGVIRVSNYTIAGQETCNISLDVTSSSVGNWVNTVDTIFTSQLGSTPVTATATLTVTAPTCNALTVTSTLDDDSCGTLRYALGQATVGSNVNISLTVPATITLSSSLTVTAGITVTGVCNPATGPTLTLSGTGVNSDGLILSGNDNVYGLWVRGFAGRQIVARQPGKNTLKCVRASR